MRHLPRHRRHLGGDRKVFRGRRKVLPGLLAILAVAGSGLLGFPMVGCSRPLGSSGESVETVGRSGRQPGLFSRPRSVAVTNSGQMAVLDRTGRIQVLDLETLEFVRQWRLPAWENGTPTGMKTDPVDDTLWIADTHYHQILHYSIEGELLFKFGTMGEGPGEFIFPTDVCPDPDGEHLWVTDYGRRNRVMLFTRQGEFVREWGAELYDIVDLDRPMSANLSLDGRELFVADAGNHRINVYNREGGLVRTIGAPGLGAGELRYPYDVVMGPDGSVFVAEFGNSRISRFSREGEFLGYWGTPGSGLGNLANPWGCTVSPAGELIVADTNNQRLQVLRRPDRAFARPSAEAAESVASAGGETGRR